MCAENVCSLRLLSIRQSRHQQNQEKENQGKVGKQHIFFGVDNNGNNNSDNLI